MGNREMCNPAIVNSARRERSAPREGLERGRRIFWPMPGGAPGMNYSEPGPPHRPPPLFQVGAGGFFPARAGPGGLFARLRSEEHTSELQSRGHLVCRLLLEKKKISILGLGSRNPDDSH